MKTDVACEMVPICCEERRGTSRKGTFLIPFFPPQNHCHFAQPVETNDNLSEALTASTPRKDEKNNICHCEHVSKTKRFGQHASPMLPQRYFFLLFFPSSYPCEQRPLCWSRRVVTDASSQKGRREEKSENTLKD